MALTWVSSPLILMVPSICWEDGETKLLLSPSAFFPSASLGGRQNLSEQTRLVWGWARSFGHDLFLWLWFPRSLISPGEGREVISQTVPCVETWHTGQGGWSCWWNHSQEGFVVPGPWTPFLSLWLRLNDVIPYSTNSQQVPQCVATCTTSK